VWWFPENMVLGSNELKSTNSPLMIISRSLAVTGGNNTVGVPVLINDASEVLHCEKPVAIILTVGRR